ncbi:hypothetical protein KSF_103270 [Reticulibacter mediterranei]|uniref:Transposase n=1 Tax=Reticulibacter mediterranei TaxID=2778369 RepID=A0A8J3IYI2_9CHLR|nr:hypothetical protein KSF_103270 [Reticulibacter mediterranei]
MARKSCRAKAAPEQTLTCLQTHCGSCGYPIKVAYRTQRTITTLQGSCRLILRARRCRNPDCAWYQRPYRPEEEGRWALPHGEFGLDVIALVGRLRYASHRSIPEIHQSLRDRGVLIAERTVTHLLQRYEELVALRLCAMPQLRERFKEQGQVILAIDGLQPDAGHEVLWVLRDCLSGEILLARSLLSACAAGLAKLLCEIQQGLEVPIQGVISDGHRSIRKAVRAALLDVPHQLCHFHYFREAAKLVYEADRHAKKELKKHIRGARPLERAVEKRDDAEAEAIRGYCLAVRSALTDDSRPPLEAPGLKLYERLSAIVASLTKVSEKGACRVS